MSAPWDRARHEAAERRCAALPAGPWGLFSDGETRELIVNHPRGEVARIQCATFDEPTPEEENLGHFITESKGTVSDALAEIRRLKAIVAEFSHAYSRGGSPSADTLGRAEAIAKECRAEIDARIAAEEKPSV